MAVYKLFPSQDTTLYSMYPTMNTGIDPINQVSNLNFALSTSPTVARTLIQFETSEIQDLINIYGDRVHEVLEEVLVRTNSQQENKLKQQIKKEIVKKTYLLRSKDEKNEGKSD